MTSNTVAGLLSTLGIDQSHSRPHVSNDNPYSEAQFKTLKYCPAFPGRFGSIEDSRVFCGSSSTTTITNTAIPGSRCTPPHSPHIGTAPEIQDKRDPQRRLLAGNQRRLSRRPYPPKLPARAWINKPPAVS